MLGVRLHGEDSPILGGSRRYSHGSIAAVNALHLHQGALLILLVREADKSVSSRLACLLVGHDFGGLARREASLEKGNQDKFVDFVSKVSDEDGVLGAPVVTTINKATARCPVQSENAISVGDGRTIQLEGLLGCVGVGKLDEAVASVTARPDVSWDMREAIGGRDRDERFTYPECLSRMILT